MPKVKQRYVCQNCGYISQSYMGRCPECGTWNQMVEEIVKPTNSSTRNLNKNSITIDSIPTSKPEKINDVDLSQTPRFHTAIKELDRVLGGGLVPGSLILIGGEPGIGKSTLLTQLASNLQHNDKRVLYVSGEESASQIKIRAQRMHVAEGNFYLLAETNMEAIRMAIDEISPDFLIIDSIQTMNEPQLDSAIGSVSQVRQITNELMNIAKLGEVTTFIVGHVTKDGSIAGPKILEHMVDTVLYFEGEKHHSYRILRAVKNRFGAANELGIFEMTGNGLEPVENPSELFLEERIKGATGSAVVVSMEGSRPILVELQALLTPTLFGNAKRTTSGLDYNRVAVIMAVLEKRGGIMLQNQDAYLKATGGVKLNEPAIDMAISVAIASSYRDREINPDISFVGELGLTGEIRRVSDIITRVQEAAKLGFKEIYLPKNNLKELSKSDLPKKIKIYGVSTIGQLLTKLDLK